MDIKAIVFDFDNTLVDYVSSDEYGMAQVVERLPVSVDPQEFLDVSVEKLLHFHRLVEQGAANLQDMHYYRLRKTLEHFAVEWSDSYLVVYRKSYVNSVTVYPGAKDLLDWLSGRVKLAVLTNSYYADEQRLRIRNSGLAAYFDDIAVCCEIGYYKPAKEAFLYFADKYQLPAASMLYVGDSEKYDIAGARGVGMRTVRIVHNKVDVSSIQTEADYVCSSFWELQELLQRMLGCSQKSEE